MRLDPITPNKGVVGDPRRSAPQGAVQRNYSAIAIQPGGIPSVHKRLLPPTSLTCAPQPGSRPGELEQPGGNSALDPLLPIPNRTVKRRRADDSADCPRESRSPPGLATTRTPRTQPPGRSCLGLSLLVVNRPAIPRITTNCHRRYNFLSQFVPRM